MPLTLQALPLRQGRGRIFSISPRLCLYVEVCRFKALLTASGESICFRETSSGPDSSLECVRLALMEQPLMEQDASLEAIATQHTTRKGGQQTGGCPGLSTSHVPHLKGNALCNCCSTLSILSAEHVKSQAAEPLAALTKPPVFYRCALCARLNVPAA